MTIQDRTAPTAAESDCATVFVAIELSRSSWVVAAHTPPADKIRLHKLAAGDVEGLLALISRQRTRAEKALGRPVRGHSPERRPHHHQGEDGERGQEGRPAEPEPGAHVPAVLGQ